MTTRAVNGCTPFLCMTLLVLPLLGCTSDPDPTTPFTPAPPWTPTPTQPWTPTPAPPWTPTPTQPRIPTASDCSPELPTKLVFTPETTVEAAIVEHLSGCTDGFKTSIVVGKDSPVPWVLDSPIKMSWKRPSPRPDVQVLRELIGQAGGLVIAPGETASVLAAPERVHLALNRGATGAWLAITPVWSQVRDKAQNKAIDLFAQGKPARKAATVCGLEGLKFGLKLGSPDAEKDNESIGENFNNVLGLTDETASTVKSCAGAIDDAERTMARDAQAVAPDGRPALTLGGAKSIAVLERPTTGNAFIAAIKQWAPKIARNL